MYESRGSSRLRVGIVGTGIAGMSAAWLLSQDHDVTVFEKDGWVGGHSNTVDVDGLGVDTGFIVYNVANYPNLIALFDHFGVATQKTDMSFGVSVNQGEFEYSGGSVSGLLAQKRNLLRPRFWRMLKDILRFYKEAPGTLVDPHTQDLTLGEYLDTNGYSQNFQRDHLLPMGAAIWSTPIDAMLDYPLGAFVRFCQNHGLMQLSERPQWRTVVGGSREYVRRLTASMAQKIHLNLGADKVWSNEKGAFVKTNDGGTHQFDHIVLASHADQSLRLLADPSAEETRLLQSFSYQANSALLHKDSALMPKNRGAWSSWNYLSDSTENESGVCVTYWMNRLQNLTSETDYFVTLNPSRMPREDKVIRSISYQHPLFDRAATAAQSRLWALQGQRRLWFCGSYFGHGFHEDALQSGLSVAEALGGGQRPWTVANDCDRINLPEDWLQRSKEELKK